jgi:Ni,Fe-hydrogenase I small subunit
MPAAPRRARVLWLQSGGCGGCTMSFLCAGVRDLPATLAGAGLELAWHPTLSEESGAEVTARLARFEAGDEPVDLLCVEGSLLRGPGGTGRFHLLAGTGRPVIDWVRALAARARHVVAVGTCAAYGGVTAAGENPAEATGLGWDGDAPGGLLGAGFRARGGLPVVNVAGCPRTRAGCSTRSSRWRRTRSGRATSTRSAGPAPTPTSSSTTAARGTSSTSSRRAPSPPPTRAA